MNTTTTIGQATAQKANEREEQPVIEQGTGRHCYAYVINVNYLPFAMPAKGWWSTPDEMRVQKAAMATAARAFKKTASVLVYELWDDGYYYLVESCDSTGRDFFTPKFHKNCDDLIEHLK